MQPEKVQLSENYLGSAFLLKDMRLEVWIAELPVSINKSLQSAGYLWSALTDGLAGASNAAFTGIRKGHESISADPSFIMKKNHTLMEGIQDLFILGFIPRAHSCILSHCIRTFIRPKCQCNASCLIMRHVSACFCIDNEITVPVGCHG